MTEPDGPGRWIGLLMLSGWTAVDTTEAVQLMVCQPMPAGCLAGVLCGQPALGLFLGGALQLLWSRLAPVGAAATPDVGPGTVAGVTVAAGLMPAGLEWHPTLTQFFPPQAAAPVVLAGFVTALATARLGQSFVVALRRQNARLVRRADDAAGRGSFSGVEWANFAGVLEGFTRGLLTLPIVLLVAGLLGRLAAPLGALFRSGPAGAPGLAPHGFGGLATNPGPVFFWWFGVAAVFTTLWRSDRKDWLWLAGGLAAGGVLTLALT